MTLRALISEADAPLGAGLIVFWVNFSVKMPSERSNLRFLMHLAKS